ncbi:PilN domain-containing protein [Pokkaliibacter sp. MBI-7]|uniref:PilN domain-containing protein n=1 Tax=Pokkaliibacter sp. MBI-7 TaxID=3040600 RepID=UPI0024468405|nr:PilN domain-containing protein [Pokkaliibacter sp. MBI-7]MDH2433611.1 PilN domain-containing protein [Pokkaliibacter sp. MBI-7]
MRINLLPWRQEREELRKKYFNQAMLGGLIVAALCLAGYWQWRNMQIDIQQGRNQYLKAQIARLDKQAGELRSIQDRQQLLLDRIDVINGLQAERPVMVNLLADVVRDVPEKVFLTAMKRSNDQVAIQGKAQNNLQVSSFLRTLDQGERFHLPNLSRVAKADSPAGWMDFDLKVDLQKPKAAEPTEGVSNGKKQ